MAGRRWFTIFIESQDIVLEVLIGVGALRHMIPVETNGTTIEKIPINQRFGLGIILDDQCICHTEQHGVIGAGPDGNRFIRQDGDQIIIVWINEDAPGSRLLAL